MRRWIWCSLAALALGHGAMAHSPVTETRPAEGAVLTASPEVIRIAFTDPIRLVGVALSGAGVETALEVPAAGAALYEFAVPTLPAGRYRVAWRGMAGDGHVMRGAFSFEVE